MSKRKHFDPRKCEICEQVFTPVHGRGKTCSESCRAEYRRRFKRVWDAKKAGRDVPPEAVAAPKGSPIKRYYCIACEHEFTPGPSSHNQKTCGEACRKEILRRRWREAGSRRWKKELDRRAVEGEPIRRLPGPVSSALLPRIPGLPCGMERERERRANEELRAMSCDQAKADHYMRRLIEAVEMGASA